MATPPLSNFDWPSATPPEFGAPVRRVVNSIIAAECLAALDAAKTSVLICATLKEYIDPTSTSELHVPISVMCDNKSLVEAIHSSTMVENKHFQIDISVLRV